MTLKAFFRLFAVIAGLAATASRLSAAEPLFNQLPSPDGGWLTSEMNAFFGTTAVNDLSMLTPGFRTASNGTHTYVAGWSGRVGTIFFFGFPVEATRYDGYITKLDPNGSIVWTKAMRDITGDAATGWPINDIAVEGNELYVCGTREGAKAFVAKLTDTGPSLICEDYTHIEPVSGTTVPLVSGTARSIAISNVNAQRQITVGGSIMGESMKVMENGKTTATPGRFTRMVLRCDTGNNDGTDGWIMTFNGSLRGTYGATFGYFNTTDSITAVAAENTGKLYMALKSENPDADPNARMHYVDDSRRSVTDANQNGTDFTGGFYHDYDFWGGSTTLLFKLDTSNATQPVTHFFYPCKLESGESPSHNHITDIAYLGGKIYVWGDWTNWIRPVSHNLDAYARYFTAGTSDCFLAILNADTLIHEKWRLFQSAGEDRALEMTVTSGGLYVAGRAGGALSTIGGDLSALGGTKTNLPGESTAAHLFWDKVSTTDLSHSWHIAPVEGGGASIPSTQRVGGVGAVGSSAIIVGGWNGGPVTMGPAGGTKTLTAPARDTGFVGFLTDTGTWKQGVRVEIVSPYGNPQPQRGIISLTAGGTIAAEVESEVYEDAAGNIISSTDQSSINARAVTRRICTGYQFKNSQVNGTANKVTFVASTDMELTFLWRTEHAVEVESELAGTDGLSSPAAGNPDPPVQKHWIQENEQFTAFIDGAEADPAVPGVRWRSTGFAAGGCVASAVSAANDAWYAWPAYQPRQQTAKITVGGPGRITWRWRKEYSLRVAVNSSVAGGAPRIYGNRPEPVAVLTPGSTGDRYVLKFPEAVKVTRYLVRTGTQWASNPPDKLWFANGPTDANISGLGYVQASAVTAGALVQLTTPGSPGFQPVWVVTGDKGGFFFPPQLDICEADAVEYPSGGPTGALLKSGTGEFWFPAGTSVTTYAPASVSSGISSLTLKGYTAGQGSVTPYDVRGASTKTVTLTEPSSITWDYARTIYAETVRIGQPITFSGVTGVDATNVNRTKAPLAGNVQMAPSGSSFNDMLAWDQAAGQAIALRPGKFTVEFENAASPADAAQNVIVEVNSVWPVPDYTHILETPAVDIDPGGTDGLKFQKLAYSEGGAAVSGTKFSAPEAGRSVLVFSSRTGGAATGNLAQEPLAVKVVNTLPWAASALATGSWAVPVTIGQEVTSTDHDSAGSGHNGYVISPLAPVNAATYDWNSMQGRLFAVNENFPQYGRWDAGNNPAHTRLLAGRIIEFDSPDDLLLDPATVKAAVSLNGNQDRTVNGVLFQTDGPANVGGSTITVNEITVTTLAQNRIDNYTGPPAFTGGTSGSAAALSEIMSDIRWTNVPNSVDVTVGGLTPGQYYNLQLLTNEGSNLNRQFDITVNGTLVVDNYTSSGHSAGRRWRPDNSYAWTGDFQAPDGGVLKVRLAQQLGGNPSTAGSDNNPILQAVIVHAVGSVQSAGTPVIAEPGTMAVAWYQMRDGIAWPWKAVRYAPQWPASPARIITASRLGSEGLPGAGTVDGPGGALTYESSIGTGSASWLRPSLDRASVTAVPVKYQAVAVVPQNDNNPAWVTSSSWNLYAFLYTGAFDPAKPLLNLTGSVQVNGNWAYLASLQAGTLYHVVLTQINPADAMGNIAVDLQGGARVLSYQMQFGSPAFSDPVVYNQPEPEALGYNPNEEHSLIASSFLDPARPAAFALRADLNRTALNADFTSKPCTLVQYTDKTDPANPVVKMAVYSIADEDNTIVDPRLPVFNQRYTYFYQGEAGQRLVPPWPVERVIGPGAYPEASNAEDVGGRIAYHEDKKFNPWIVSGDTDAAEDIRAEIYYPLHADFWHPVLEPGEVIPLGHLAGAAPVRDIFYNTIWPADVAVLKAGETLTFSGGEYATDHNADTVRPKGLPGAAAWQCAKLLFDSTNVSLAPGDTGGKFLARVFPALEKREVPLALTALPDELKPAAGNLIVEGLLWRFKQLPASLQKRVYYDSSSQKLCVRGYLNDKTLGDADLLAAPGAQTILQPNVLTEADAALVNALSTNAAWITAVSTLSSLSRSPLGASVSGSLGIGLEPASGGALPVTVFGPGLAVVTNPALQNSATAGTLPDGYITIAENDDPALGDAPVAIHIVRVTREKYRGSIAVINPENVFDEKLTLRHTADFGGDVKNLFFEWHYREEDGRDLNPPGVNLPAAGTPTAADWAILQSGEGLNEIQLSGASPATITDNVFYVRYRHKDDSSWSAWGGAANSREPKPASPSAAVDIAYVAQLAPGWIKRVTNAVNVFDARINDFRNNNAPATYTSMIQQAGQRWEGPVAFNPQKDAIENYGLIELYQTVLDRGMDLTIDIAPGTDGVNTALLNAANRIAGLYTLMGNEAMADAQDPTVGFTTVAGQTGSLSPVIHSFQNQTGNLLEEELGMLRGRGEVGARPAYNRLLWNFTNGQGEAAYALNYAISDLTNDGFINEADARRLYPQGHGDAWGHYTMALKGYYDLAILNNFTWSSRSEKYLIEGVVLDVDYLDERAFAKTAAVRAQAGAALVDLVYRQSYTENPNGQWQGYRDTNTDRAWGVMETAQRSGTAALCDWMMANAMLKAEETDPAKTGIRRVDRTTTGELRLIAQQASAIQATLDSADHGMNPAGLDPDVVPFDIDPVLTDRTNPNASTHFEQVYDRAVAANRNALLAFNHASTAGLLVRQTATSTEALRQQTIDNDRSLRNQLIEYFGTPYEGMIGAGKAYPSGYNGPDLYLFMYLDQVSAGGDVLPGLDGDMVATTIVPGLRNLATDTNPFAAGATGVDALLRDTVSNYFPADVPLPSAGASPITLNLPRLASSYALTAPSGWGQRRSPGAIQAAIQELIQAEWRLRTALDVYEGTSDDFKLLLRKFEVKSGISAEKIRLAAYAEDRQDLWNNVATVAFAGSNVLDHTREVIAILADGFHEAFPRSVGLATDATSPARSLVKLTHALTDGLMRAAMSGFQITQYRAELESDEAMVEMEQALLTEDLKSELVDILAEIQQLVNDEGDLRVAVIGALESLRAASDRVRTVTEKGMSLIEERTVFNQRVASTTTKQRYEDYTFRVTHTEALRKYRSSFDIAARYAYLAGKAYQFELNLPDNHAANASPLLAEMLRTRTLGEWDGNSPVVGQGGIAEQLAILKTNFGTLKGQLGFNNPATEVNSFSVRAELGRVGLSSRVNADWRTKMETWRVPDLWNYQYQSNGVNYGYVFRRFCRPFAPEAAGAQPALVIPFDSTIAAGKNWFGLELTGGDSSFNASNFSTKIRSAGVRFDGYNNTALSQTPQVYLVPVGLDRMFLPNSNTLTDRAWNVVDQRIPVPLPISPTNLTDPNWQPYTGAASGFFEEIRQFSSFRAYHDAGGYSAAEMLSTGRLVGRSVWNTQWVLIIPAATLLNDPANPSAGIDTLIYGSPLPGFTQADAGTANRDLIGARDIRILLQTYSISGN